jgi:hypothetical protein
MVRPCGLEAFGLEEGKDRNHRSEECGQHEDVASHAGIALNFRASGSRARIARLQRVPSVWCGGLRSG